MSRSGYSDDCENLAMWRGAVRSAIRGKRGQAMLRDLAAALDAMPVKVLAADSLVTAEGEFCTLGALGAARGLDMKPLEEVEPEQAAKAFGIAPALAAEIMYMNDEWGRHRYDHATKQYRDDTPAERWTRMRAWVAEQVAAPQAGKDSARAAALDGGEGEKT